MHTINKYKNKIMAQLSDRLNRLAPSATLAMSQKSSEMKAQGIDVINMSVGEPTSTLLTILNRQQRRLLTRTIPVIHQYQVILTCEKQL